MLDLARLTTGISDWQRIAKLVARLSDDRTFLTSKHPDKMPVIVSWRGA
jgi:hypothetical protein